jgi:hypothetical protein
MIKDILKHLLIMIVITLVIVLSMPYCKKALQELIQFYPIILQHLSHVFAGSKIGTAIKEVLAILLLPLAVTAAVSGAYYIIKRTWMPHLINLSWILWIIVISAIVVLRG